MEELLACSTLRLKIISAIRADNPLWLGYSATGIASGNQGFLAIGAITEFQIDGPFAVWTDSG